MPHIHEKIDNTVEVFIVHQNRVLLRMHDKYKIWLSVGGHVELDEDPNEAALREVKEEVGLDVRLDDRRQLFRHVETDGRELIPPTFLKRHRISPTHEHVVMTFFATSDTSRVTVEGHDDRSDEWRWVTLEELEKMDLRPDVRFYAQTALKELGQ
jgi:8-oxo-dGTP pyrophosphatase MutT (NUDIX family)